MPATARDLIGQPFARTRPRHDRETAALDGNPIEFRGHEFDGAPGEIRTPDHLVRSQVLYPAELRARGRHSSGIRSRAPSVAVRNRAYAAEALHRAPFWPAMRAR